MKRADEERDRTKREWRKHLESHLRGINPGKGLTVQCECDKQPGRFRKRKAHDCGRPQCQVCHPHKYPKRQPTMGELRAPRYDEVLYAGIEWLESL